MIVSSIIASTAFAISAAIGFAGTIASGVCTAIGFIGALAIYGGTALMASKKKNLGYNSATYDGPIQTQTDQNLPVPLLYGTCKLAGNRIWQDFNNGSMIKRIVAFAEGEITEYKDIRLNDVPYKELAGCKISKYYGTQSQMVDSIVGGSNQRERAEKVGSLKNIAYLAISVPKGQKVDVNYNLTAVVKGRKIRVYKNKYSYEIKYSENPAWAMFDFLSCYNGLGLCIDETGNINDSLIEELFDLDSFIEAAAYCDELIEYLHTDENGKTVVDMVPRFTFNMIFDSQTAARTLIDEIYRSCRGGLFIKNGRLQFKIDKAEPVSKVFTCNDIIKGSETFQTIPQEEQYDILKCTYVSPEHEWQKVEATAEIPQYRSGVPIEHSVNIYSCTNFNQASRLAWYYVNAKRLQPYFGTFQTDYKGYDVEVGDVISIDSLLMGLNSYKVKVTRVIDNGAGVFTIEWRSYDDRLYTDELGSKEPRVLISNISDVIKSPDDVKNFNVVQSNNIFNFVWEANTNSLDSYEIRMGESWSNSTIIKKGILENKYSCEILTNGLFKFWIKAFNGYNYSENATLDVVSVDSVPSINEIVKINVLDEMLGVPDEAIKLYRNTLKLQPTDAVWNTTDEFWQNGNAYYQNLGYWGAEVERFGMYESQVYDIGDILECIVSFDYKISTPDEQNFVVVEWAYSRDGVDYSPWAIVNTGMYVFRYCKFRVSLKSYNGVQIVMTDFVVNIDVPDKDLDMELEITDSDGLKIEYSFVKPPSIVATVNDDIDAYIVVAEKTSKYAVLKAYTNSGEATTCKLSLRAKGY